MANEAALRSITPTQEFDRFRTADAFNQERPEDVVPPVEKVHRPPAPKNLHKR